MIGRGHRTAPWTEAELERVEAARRAGETLRTIATRHHVSVQHIRLVLFRIASWRRLGEPLTPPFRQYSQEQLAVIRKEQITELRGRLATMPAHHPDRGAVVDRLKWLERHARDLRE